MSDGGVASCSKVCLAGQRPAGGAGCGSELAQLAILHNLWKTEVNGDR